MRRAVTVALAAASLCLFAGIGHAADANAGAGSALDRTLIAAEQRLGHASPDLLPILAPLARQRFRDGEIGEALALRRRSLAIAVAAFGGASPRAAEAMVALATLYLDLYRFLDAEPLLVVARSSLSREAADEGPALAAVYAELARVALARGHRHRAGELARKARRLDPAATGPLRTLGAALAAEGAYDEAERTLRQAVTADRHRGEKNALAAARSLAALGQFYLRRKNYAAALPAIEEATAIDQRELAPDHPLIAADFHDLGIAYLGLKRTRLAEIVTGAAVRRLDRPGERDTPQFAYTLIELAHAEQALGRSARAKSLLDRAGDILRTANDAQRERERRL
jgi:tetratricopeptide (TPR) repeat protein